MIMIFWWDRALDKLVLSFSSIPLDFCSIKYLKLNLLTNEPRKTSSPKSTWKQVYIQSFNGVRLGTYWSQNKGVFESAEIIM